MTTTRKRSNIIFFKNINVADYDIESIFKKRLLAGIPQDQPVSGQCYEYNKPKFDKIPKYFVSLLDWPKQTNLKCWKCHMQFSDRPKFVATDIIVEKGVKKYKPHGNFCEFSCVMKYIDDRWKDRKDELHWKYTNLLHIVYKIFTGRSINYIQRSNCIYDTKPYGGNMTVDEYVTNKRMQNSVTAIAEFN